MLIQHQGTIQFNPINKTKKHNEQHSWKRVAMIVTNDDLCDYYSWFIKKRFDLILNKPLRGSHITFVNDRDIEVPNFDIVSDKFNNSTINFYIDPEPRTNGEHWWLRVYCKEAEDIRVLCGGTAQPYFSFHLTIGYANEKWIDYSNYVLHICKQFELISNMTRQDFNEHEIINLK